MLLSVSHGEALSGPQEDYFGTRLLGRGRGIGKGLLEEVNPGGREFGRINRVKRRNREERGPS